MKIYTKKGDEGQTSLIGGTRVPKHHIRIEAYGTVDELNSMIGLLRCQAPVAPFNSFLHTIQDQLFTIGSSLATDPKGTKMQLPEITAEAITALEHSIDEQDAQLPPLKNFILPGGHSANAIAHSCRCICRRAERLAVHLHELEGVNPLILQYLNRLSDWFFVFARTMSLLTKTEEITWKGRG